MMFPTPTYHIQTRRGNNVRIGPVSIITLIAVISMAVLAVLSASTSYASATISDRQAESTKLMYVNESAGQEFLASLDDVLAAVRAQGGSAEEGAAAVEGALDEICEHARIAGDGRVSCTASVDGTKVNAEFICENTRRLGIAITIRNDATYRVDAWKSTSAQQGSSSGGTLWSGA